MRERGASAAEVPATYTRREVLTTLPGSAVVGSALAALGAAALLSGCGDDDSNAGSLDVLEVAKDAVVTLDSFKEITKPTRYYSVSTLATLAAGSQLFASEGEVAAVFTPGETSSPLSTVSLMDMASGTTEVVLPQAVGHDEGFSIYEVRCSDSLLLWVESNYLTASWRVYSAKIASGALSIGDPVLLDEGDVQYDAPEIEVAGEQAYWIYQPAEDGEHTSEDSYLKTSSGAAAPAVVITSHGRFNGGLSVSDRVVTCMPRADASSGVYYALTAVNGGGIVAQQVLPRSFRPTTAIYVNNAFSFGIGASYDYGEGIANVGTYYPLGNGTWLRLIKQPLAPLGVCNGWLFCKSGSRTVFVDPGKRRYFTVNAPSDCADWGDYSVRMGATSSVVNYTTITKVSQGKKTASTQVRRITLSQI